MTTRRWVRSSPAQAVRSAVDAAVPRLGGSRLVCIDGPAGSGKTSLAAQVAQSSSDLRPVVVHMDDLYEGWTGLESSGPRLRDQVLEPLAAGRVGRYQRYDWDLERFAEWHEVPPTPLLVVEGVGCYRRELAALVSVLVWVEVPPEVALARGIARDGEAMRGHWLAFRDEESALHAREGTREAADLLVDGRWPDRVLG